MNYFELFGLEADFSIDLTSLATTYQALQKTVHPDRFAHSSSQDQMLAVQKSSQINDAYQTLKNPVKRGEYLLQLRNTELPEEQSTFQDVDFLMVQMELREMLAEIKFAKDIDTALMSAEETLDIQSRQLWQEFEQLLGQHSDTANQQAGEVLRKLKFYQKLYIELERIEDTLFDD
ncbi:co-chaperone HscB [Thalassotalea mangrovi]|uniref:Co-chaperone protein HscB homolog n=1 Tax=Thalassotalea mangrovi TaxID=2572245 RepID=A0A4U1B4W3_9GAMM|nr:co-chaperone HscB [Thalassotalea mangrovi]TKB44510.1 co-chaperone HscB [Thalassotalea mangrovi]